MSHKYKYSNRTDFNATFIHTDTGAFNTNRKLANRALKAMSDLQYGIDQGTIRDPYELASSVMPDGRSLIQTIYEDGEVRFSDGWYIVEVDAYIMYVDLTGFAVNEMIKQGELPPEGKYPYIIDEDLKNDDDFEGEIEFDEFYDRYL